MVLLAVEHANELFNMVLLASIYYFRSFSCHSLCVSLICTQGRGSRGGARGAPDFLSQGDGYACAPPPKFWQSLGISTFLPPPKKKSFPSPCLYTCVFPFFYFFVLCIPLALHSKNVFRNELSHVPRIRPPGH